MNLKLDTNHLQIIKNHAESTYPEECCGILLGDMGSECKTVVEVIPTENSWHTEAANFTEETHSRTRRYAIAPPVMLQIQKEARNRNLSIIGIYHSHPDYPAIPSQWDRLYAWPEYSYLIVSVQNGQAGECQSWSLDDNHQFQTETIELIDRVWGVGEAGEAGEEKLILPPDSGAWR
ncbi:M67 family metallopeptidase [Sphaerospermopsis aphanizomenoides BCCUSP55]|nr:M67 family metallopeptidase [Sphaerospermopsis aphanizomenoides BCCUSP55]